MTKYICKACGHDYSEGAPHAGLDAPPKTGYWISLLPEAAAKAWLFPCPTNKEISWVLAVEEALAKESLPSFLPKPKVWEGKARF